jgi:hypothetical protein
MTNKLQNKIDELIKLEELHNIKEQYRQHEKTKSLYEQIDFIPLPQDIMDQCNTRLGRGINEKRKNNSS